MRALYIGFKPAVYIDAKRAQAFLGQGHLHIITGLQYGNEEIYQQVRESGEPYIFIDRGYFCKRGPRFDTLRMTLNGYQHNVITPRPADRMLALHHSGRIHIQPYRTQSAHILIVPPSSPQVARMLDVGTAEDWAEKTKYYIRQYTNREIKISYKGDPIPLMMRLANCHAVITLTSNVAVDALCAGIPIFCHSLSAAYPIDSGMVGISKRLNTPVCSPRVKWLCSLAYAEFTLEEIRNGFFEDVIFGKES